MFDENPDMICIHPVFYLKGNNFLMESLALIKYPEKFKRTLKKMLNTIKSDIFPNNDNYHSVFSIPTIIDLTFTSSREIL